MKLTKKITIEQTAQLIKQCNSIALFAHTNPDGDTVGSCVALAHALKQLGKTAQIFCDTPITGKLATFDETKLISQKFFGNYDLFVAVDCGDIFRVGEFSGMYDATKETLTIDHHGGECFSKYNCLYQYASTCQIIYEILKCLGADINPAIATYLYVGLCTDTSNFSNSNTDADSHIMAGELIPLGADFQRVNRTFFRDIELNELKLHARVLSRLRTYYDGQMVLLYVFQSDIDEFGLDNTVTAGLVHYANDVVSAKVAVCISQDGENAYKVSMRGKNFNVREVCQYFGGGGHLYASGCRICGFFEDVVEKLVRVVGFTL